MSEMPLVLSMTAVQNFMRCKKMFEFDTMLHYQPKRDDVPGIVNFGSQFHAYMAHAAEYGELPQPDGEPAYEVAAAYLAAHPLPEPNRILSIERGYFTEIAPGFHVRGSFDLVYYDDQDDYDPDYKKAVVQDYKTFLKAPTPDVDMDFQARVYLTIAEDNFKMPAKFRWVYARQELGRFLTKKVRGESVATWVPWDEEDLYPQPQELEMSEFERETTRRELYNVALDIQETLRHRRTYRVPNYREYGNGVCGGCFFKPICKADWFGTLSDDELDRLTDPYNPADRVDPRTMLDDPRVDWLIEERRFKIIDAVQAVYGVPGRAAVEAFWKDRKMVQL
jgi:hypothetical protein